MAFFSPVGWDVECNQVFQPHLFSRVIWLLKMPGLFLKRVVFQLAGSHAKSVTFLKSYRPDNLGTESNFSQLKNFFKTIIQQITYCFSLIYDFPFFPNYTLPPQCAQNGQKCKTINSFIIFNDRLTIKAFLERLQTCSSN